MAETTPITPVDLLDAQQPFGDASLVAADRSGQKPSVVERYLRSPLLFWFSQALLLAPLALFLLQGLAHELGQSALARDINLLLFGASGRTIVGDILPVLLLPAMGIVLALTRIRDAKPGLDRKLTIWMAFTGIAGIGVVFAYALIENVGRFFR